MEYNTRRNSEDCILIKKVRLNADSKSLKKLRDYSYELGIKYLKNKELVFEFILCVDEIFTNCIVHAYKQKGGSVDVNFFLSGEYFVTQIRDYGVGISVANKKKYISLCDDLLMFCGRGLFLVNNLCDKLIIRRCEDSGTNIIFYFKTEGFI